VGAGLVTSGVRVSRCGRSGEGGGDVLSGRECCKEGQVGGASGDGLAKLGLGHRGGGGQFGGDFGLDVVALALGGVPGYRAEGEDGQNEKGGQDGSAQSSTHAGGWDGVALLPFIWDGVASLPFIWDGVASLPFIWDGVASLPSIWSGVA